MRIMPFMKRKKGVQFAGIGLDTGGGGGGGSYVLPTATANRLGGVKVGNGLEVAEDGTLSTSGGGGGGGLDFSTIPHVIGKYGNKDLYSISFVHSALQSGSTIGTLPTVPTAVIAVFGTYGYPNETPTMMIGNKVEANYSGSASYSYILNNNSPITGGLSILFTVFYTID